MTFQAVDTFANVGSCNWTVTIIPSGPPDGSVATSAGAALGANDDALTLSVFPNPTPDRASVWLEHPNQSAAGEVELQLGDGCGQILESRRLEMEGGRLRAELDLSGYSQGSYFLVTRWRGQLLRRTIVRR